MSLETQAQRFIDTLNELGGSAGNGKLSSALGWADDTYERVKAQLIEAGQIVPGRGRGGSVALVEGRTSNASADAQADAPKRSNGNGNGRKPESNTYTQAFNAIDKAMRNDEGLASELDYAEQTSWLLFLKYLDDMEHEWADEAALEGREYESLLESPYRWQDWAAPKTAEGKLHANALTGSDLIDFVNAKLIPHLKSFKDSSVEADSLEYKIGEIFSEVSNRFRSGYTLRDVLQIVDTLSFGSSEAKHELSDLYETRIKRMGNAGRNGGEYYTPRPLIRAMIEVVQPKVGETIYDGACGSAGFLCEAWAHLRRDDLSATDWDTLQHRTFYGQEKKSLAYVLGVMNMILHGIDAPNIRHANTLAENVMDIREKDRHDIVLANPPFGGGERPEVQQNFPIRS
ncbi:MAG: N-6 DNA methylase, partial [Lysobacterales bacterium]